MVILKSALSSDIFASAETFCAAADLAVPVFFGRRVGVFAAVLPPRGFLGAAEREGLKVALPGVLVGFRGAT